MVLYQLSVARIKWNKRIKPPLIPLKPLYSALLDTRFLRAQALENKLKAERFNVERARR